MTDVGTYLSYRDRRFGDADLATVRTADEIVATYEAAGLAMTVRQLYYQFVSRGLIANEKRSYDRLKDLVNDARLAGLVSWTGIEDRTRNLRGVTFYQSPVELLRSARESYLTDRWANQPMRPEVWIEKDALAGVIEPICRDESVDFFACRGYNSQSEQWRAGQRFAGYVQKGQRPVVIHLGDHDPSGIDMTRDNRDRLEMFAGVPVLVVRVALNHDQVLQYDPPPNPAKVTDSRAADYIARFGRESWELDALAPPVLRDLVLRAINRFRDPARWDEALAKEATDKERVDELIDAALGDEK